MKNNILAPIHPGIILKEEFLDPMEITQYRLSKDIGVDRTRINQIVNGERSISADTAIRLSTYFGLSDRYWLNAQTLYDIETAKEKFTEAEIRQLAMCKGRTKSAVQGRRKMRQVVKV
ncbi:HigA family addiction module antitoxin [bacterium]|nr:HigA family addiction module antidote protein [Verrucomicrobiota bacterium]MDA7632698.1 HigA family addiction module antitoxin [bacterium]MDB4796578.1 HigA family addiction module antitoxin [bacterium]